MTFLSHAGGHLDLSRIYKLIWNRLTMKSPWDIWVGMPVISIRLFLDRKYGIIYFQFGVRPLLYFCCTSVVHLLYLCCTSVLLLLYTPTPNWDYIITKILLQVQPIIIIIPILIFVYTTKWHHQRGYLLQGREFITP